MQHLFPSQTTHHESLVTKGQPSSSNLRLKKYYEGEYFFVFVFTHQIQAASVPIPKQTETIIVVPVIVLLKGPKYGSSQLVYNSCICAIFLSIEETNKPEPLY